MLRIERFEKKNSNTHSIVFCERLTHISRTVETKIVVATISCGKRNMQRENFQIKLNKLNGRQGGEQTYINNCRICGLFNSCIVYHWQYPISGYTFDAVTIGGRTSAAHKKSIYYIKWTNGETEFIR